MLPSRSNLRRTHFEPGMGSPQAIPFPVPLAVLLAVPVPFAVAVGVPFPFLFAVPLVIPPVLLALNSNFLGHQRTHPCLGDPSNDIYASIEG